MPAPSPTRPARGRRVAAPSKKVAPTRAVERDLQERGHTTVVGVDEVGRGAWAGPLAVGAAG